MKDREDEEEIQQHFCFVLADEMEGDGIISYHTKRVLELGDLILPLFSSACSTTCLMLHVAKQDHGVMVEDGCCEDAGSTSGGEGAEGVEEEGERATERRIRKHQRTVIYNDRNNDSCSNYSEDIDYDEDMAAGDTDLPRMFGYFTKTGCSYIALFESIPLSMHFTSLQKHPPRSNLSLQKWPSDSLKTTTTN